MFTDTAFRMLAEGNTTIKKKHVLMDELESVFYSLIQRFEKNMLIIFLMALILLKSIMTTVSSYKELY